MDIDVIQYRRACRRVDDDTIPTRYARSGSFQRNGAHCRAVCIERSPDDQLAPNCVQTRAHDVRACGVIERYAGIDGEGDVFTDGQVTGDSIWRACRIERRIHPQYAIKTRGGVIDVGQWSEVLHGVASKTRRRIRRQAEVCRGIDVKRIGSKAACSLTDVAVVGAVVPNVAVGDVDGGRATGDAVNAECLAGDDRILHVHRSNGSSGRPGLDSNARASIGVNRAIGDVERAVATSRDGLVHAKTRRARARNGAIRQVRRGRRGADGLENACVRMIAQRAAIDRGRCRIGQVHAVSAAEDAEIGERRRSSREIQARVGRLDRHVIGR